MKITMPLYIKVYRSVMMLLLSILVIGMTLLCCAVVGTPIFLMITHLAPASVLWWEVPGSIILAGYSIFIEYCKHMAKAIASEIGD